MTARGYTVTVRSLSNGAGTSIIMRSEDSADVEFRPDVTQLRGLIGDLTEAFQATTAWYDRQQH